MVEADVLSKDDDDVLDGVCVARPAAMVGSASVIRMVLAASAVSFVFHVSERLFVIKFPAGCCARLSSLR